MKIQSTKTWLKGLYGHRPDMLAVAMAHAESIIARLEAAWNRSKGSATTYSARYRQLTAAADAEISDILGKTDDIPCRLGCNHCCQDERIPLTETEAQLIVQHVEEQLPAEEKQRVIESILASAPTSDVANVPCAFLIDGRCAVYGSRPLACRTYFSTSLASCEAFVADKSKQPHVWLAPKVVLFAAREVSRAAKHSHLYDINVLLKRIYSDPERAKAWAAGMPSDESALAED